MISAAQMWPVRNEKDATGTLSEFWGKISVPVRAQVVLVLTVAIIILLLTVIGAFLIGIKEKSTAKENANGVTTGRSSPDVGLNE